MLNAQRMVVLPRASRLLLVAIRSRTELRLLRSIPRCSGKIQRAAIALTLTLANLAKRPRLGEKICSDPEHLSPSMPSAPR